MELLSSHEVEPAEIREKFGHALIDGEEVFAALRLIPAAIQRPLARLVPTGR